ncbi:YdcF family protein [Sphingomonas sp. LB-2]|uniref:YdcF family protein n=1 Tax=Sphingomonas caeni TaxID=2984949 RepID=UPI002232CA1B|nr:YdcF family protein [Sphingomonas caeni]MCW3849159.1 YdcF family protein [Sphingomonas caeni]
MSDLSSVTDEDSLDRELTRQMLGTVWRVLRWPLLLLGLLLGWLLYLVASIMIIGGQHSTRTADVGIVLGAGVTNGKPSAPFVARIDYAVQLYKAGRVRRLLMSGGPIMGQREEALVGRDRAMALGVPADAILIEPKSWTTYLNFVESKQVMDANGATTALVITEPFHMMRSLRMARDLGMNVQGEPTPRSFYRTFSQRYRFIASELFLYLYYLRYGR